LLKEGYAVQCTKEQSLLRNEKTLYREWLIEDKKGVKVIFGINVLSLTNPKDGSASLQLAVWWSAWEKSFDLIDRNSQTRGSG